MRALIVAAEQLSGRIRLGIAVLLGVFLGYQLASFMRSDDLLMSDGSASTHEMAVGALQQDLTSCEATAERLDKSKRSLAQESAYLKQSVIVEQEACYGVRESLQSSQEEISKLHEQLAFYRGIVSPEESQAGVRIYKFEMYPLREKIYGFRLVLLQSVRRGSEARGKVNIELDVLDKGRINSLSMNELLLEGSYSEEYRFRYYTELFGEFSLPDGVQVLRLSVSLKPRGKRNAPLVRTFMWNKLLSAGAKNE